MIPFTVCEILLINIDSKAIVHVGILLKTFDHTGLNLSETEQLSLNDDLKQVLFLSVSTVAS